MKITWHGHACFELCSSEGSVVIDPYVPDYVKGLRLPPVTADMTICSHGHSDHCCPEAVTPTGKTPSFSVQQIDCFHDECMGAKRGKNLITVIEAEGMRIAHCGDIGHMLNGEALQLLGKIDILMIPVGGVYTVDAKGAKEICDAVKPTMIVPMHYKGNSVGLQNISTVDDFLALYPQDMIELLPTNELTVESIEKPSVTVFAWP